jgi:MurNAc alpha-1-phosphate uridylyltransferase
MRGMILAAGRGARMGALTEDKPKALLKIANRYLIEYSIEALLKADIREVVINVCYRGEQIMHALGDGSRYGMTFHYSEEEEALETGGGIFKALPLLGSDPFMVLSCDVITAFPLSTLLKKPEKLAHLVLVDNPSFHPTGDFCLHGKKVYLGGEQTLTFGNIGVYHPALFSHCMPGKFRLGSLLKHAIANEQVTGEHYQGVWHNVGTPGELSQVSCIPFSA